MKILVLSDSHSSLHFMRKSILKIRPDHVVHLGDHYDDGRALAEENPHVRFHQVPGNCDRCRGDFQMPEIMCYDIAGVRFYMTHGHKHAVKSDLYRLLADARKMNANAVLFGHTHQAYYTIEDDGLLVLNPGTCGSSGGSVGLIEAEDGKISACRVLRQTDLDML